MTFIAANMDWSDHFNRFFGNSIIGGAEEACFLVDFDLFLGLPGHNTLKAYKQVNFSYK